MEKKYLNKCLILKVFKFFIYLKKKFKKIDQIKMRFNYFSSSLYVLNNPFKIDPL